MLKRNIIAIDFPKKPLNGGTPAKESNVIIIVIDIKFKVLDNFNSIKFFIFFKLYKNNILNIIIIFSIYKKILYIITPIPYSMHMYKSNEKNDILLYE